MKLVHPHCDIVVDTKPWVQDLLDTLEGAHEISQFLRAREQLDQRQQQWQQWLTQHGYQAGRDYWRCKEGYRFSHPSLALAFTIGAQ